MQIGLIFFFMLWMPLKAITPQDLSIEEKVGQVLMVFFFGNEANEQARQLIEEMHIGNVILYQWANELSSPQQVQKLCNGLQEIVRKRPHGIPLLISVDQEGGRINRLTNGFVVFPSNADLAKSEYAFNIEKCAYATGQQLKAVGINMNLAPVIDVNSNPNATVMGNRSYSSKAQEVALCGRLALHGYNRAGVIATLKHFPGYGEVCVDPHIGLPTNNKSLGELRDVELLPFRELCSSSDVIMSAHILVPAIDSKNCATFSHKLIAGLLRKEMGYLGVIISDSLVMQGILGTSESLEEVAIRAFEAGHDILCFGGRLLLEENTKELVLSETKQIHKSLVDVVKSGRISEERLDASVQRILSLKEKYGLFDAVMPNAQSIIDNVNTEEQKWLREKVVSN